MPKPKRPRQTDDACDAVLPPCSMRYNSFPIVEEEDSDDSFALQTTSSTLQSMSMAENEAIVFPVPSVIMSTTTARKQRASISSAKSIAANNSRTIHQMMDDKNSAANSSAAARRTEPDPGIDYVLPKQPSFRQQRSSISVTEPTSSISGNSKVTESTLLANNHGRSSSSSQLSIETSMENRREQLRSLSNKQLDPLTTPTFQQNAPASENNKLNEKRPSWAKHQDRSSSSSLLLIETARENRREQLRSLSNKQLEPNKHDRSSSSSKQLIEISRQNRREQLTSLSNIQLDPLEAADTNRSQSFREQNSQKWVPEDYLLDSSGSSTWWNSTYLNQGQSFRHSSSKYDIESPAAFSLPTTTTAEEDDDDFIVSSSPAKLLKEALKKNQQQQKDPLKRLHCKLGFIAGILCILIGIVSVCIWVVNAKTSPSSSGQVGTEEVDAINSTTTFVPTPAPSRVIAVQAYGSAPISTLWSPRATSAPGPPKLETSETPPPTWWSPTKQTPSQAPHIAPITTLWSPKQQLETTEDIFAMQVDGGADAEKQARIWMTQVDEYVPSTPQDEKQRFLCVLLYVSTSGSTWRRQSGFLNPKLHVCDWHIGITCNTQQEIVAIDLAKNNLTGTLMTEIGLLSSLQSIQLLENSFTGNIPSQLFQLPLLESVSMGRNGFRGTLPSNMTSSLKQLDLSYNTGIEGTLPSSLASLTQLTELSLGWMTLTGALPAELPPNMVKLNLQHNAALRGNLGAIGGLSFLEVLDLSQNEFTGTLPVLSSSSVTQISLSQNQLEGNLDQFLGFLPSTRLTTLWLDRNQLQGTLPALISKFYRLQNLGLWDNKLTGQMPSTLGQLSNLGFGLDLKSNHFSGTIPSELSNLKTVELLDVSSNRLTGSIPSGLVGNFKTLLLQQNSLTGTVPILGDDQNLQYLTLQQNQLSGKIPSCGTARVEADCGAGVQCECCSVCCDSDGDCT